MTLPQQYKSLDTIEGVHAALTEAMSQPTLTAALAHIARWDHIRSCNQIKAGIATFTLYDELFDVVIKNYIWTQGSSLAEPTVHRHIDGVISLPHDKG